MLTGLELGLTISLSYLTGFITGGGVFLKYRKKLLIDSSNNLNLNSANNHHFATFASPVLEASAPSQSDNKITKITLE